jgi:hypothetical protein
MKICCLEPFASQELRDKEEPMVRSHVLFWALLMYIAYMIPSGRYFRALREDEL